MPRWVILQPVYKTGHDGGPITVIDVDHCDIRGAVIEPDTRPNERDRQSRKDEILFNGSRRRAVYVGLGPRTMAPDLALN